MSREHIDYPMLIDNAMRSVVREALRNVSSTGLPGEHHFFITFLTTHPQAKISDALHARYPREMTIVLQHQFWDFKVDDVGFTVTLSFGGVTEKLYIPFSAMTAFADPGVKFGLQFQTMEEQEWRTAPAANSAEPLGAQHEDADAAEEAAEAGGAEIISLDAFRKK